MKGTAAFVFAISLASAVAAQTGPVLHASATSGGSVSLSWTAVSGAAQYQIRRSTSWPSWSMTWTSGSLVMSDTVATNSAFIYQVQPLNAQAQPIGSPTNAALVTTFGYTSDPLLAGSHLVSAQHVSELRTVVNAARVAAGLPTTGWTHATVSGTVKKEDISDLRAALDAALVNIGLTPQSYVDAGSLAGVVIRSVHVAQIRVRLRSFPPLIGTSGGVTNPLFSPNGDGQKDTSTLNASLGGGPDTRWIVNVRRVATNAVVRSVTGSTATVAFPWDGRDGASVLQTDGLYRFEVVNHDGLAAVPVMMATTTLDNTAPAVAIASPSAGTVASNVRHNEDVNVTGTTTDVNFASWKLEQTGNGQNDVTIATGTSAIPTPAQLGMWHSAGLPNGAYALKLTATDGASNTSNVSVSVTAGHFTTSQDRYQINASAGERVRYTSIVPFTVTEVLTIRNDAGQTVRTLVNEQRTAGTRNDAWDGTNDAGQLVGDGVYRYFVTVTEGSSTLVWDVSNQTIGTGARTALNYPQCRTTTGAWIPCNSAPSNFGFDPYTNKPLRIRFCVGVGDPPSCQASGPAQVIAKLTDVAETSATCSPCMDIGYRAGGAHEITWYGVPIGQQVVSNVPRMAIIRLHDMIPRNLTVVYGTPVTIAVTSVAPPIFYPLAASFSGSQQITVSVTAYGSRQASLRAQFRNLGSSSILRTIDLPSAAPGTFVIQWNGRADNGAWVAPGLYEVIITATDSAGGTAITRPLTTVRY